jgi:RNA polymerase sigma-70 factor (ECF subfamily)
MILAAAMNPEAFSGAQDAIARMRRGDPDALTAVISRYQHRLYRYLLRLVREPAAADDLFQQTWLRVMEKIGRYDARRNFESWLFSVAHNLAIDAWRGKRGESLDDAGDGGDSGGPASERPARGRSGCVGAATGFRARRDAGGLHARIARHPSRGFDIAL